MAFRAVWRIRPDKVGRAGGAAVFNGFVTHGATRAFFWKVAGEAVVVCGCVEAATVGGRFRFAVTLDARVFFVTGAAGISVPRGLESVGLSLPTDGVALWGLALVAVFAEVFRGVAHAAVAGIDAEFMTVEALPHVG
jgi:hypothetical protein